MKKIIPVFIITAAVMAGILYAPEIYQSTLPKTGVTRVKEMVYTDSVSAKGEVAKRDSKVIQSEMPLAVSGVHVKNGDSVDVGQKIISVDRYLTARKIMTSSQYSSLLSMSGAGATSYEDILAMIPQQITSDVAGTIESVNVSKGDFITADYTIASLIGSDGLMVVVPVSENVISKVQVGQVAVITGSGFNKEYSGTVEEIAGEAKKEYVGTTQDTVVEVKIRFTDADDSIRVGYTAKVKILTSDEKTVRIVPYEAVMEDENNREYVYVFNGGVAVRKDIQTGLELQDGVEVLEGVAPEDPILSKPGEIQEGQFVKLVED